MTKPRIPFALSLRSRIALWSTLVVAAAVALLAIAVSSLFSSGLRDGTDALLREDLTAIESILVLNRDGNVEVFSLGPEGAQEDEFIQHLRFQIRDEQGSIIYSSRSLAGHRLPRIEPRGLFTSNLRDAHLAGELVRVIAGTVTVRDGARRREVHVQALRSIAPFARQEARLYTLLAWLLPVPILLAALGAWFTAGHNLRPLRGLIAGIRELGAENLNRRLSVDRRDEAGQLAEGFNALFGRLERAFESLRRFTADASHELRSPLTALRARGEVALARRRSATYYRAAIAGMLEDTARLERTVATLLELARADAGVSKPRLDPIELGAHLRAWLDCYDGLAAERDVSLVCDVECDLHVRADAEMLDRAVGNVLDNALRFTPRGGSIRLSASPHGKKISIRVCDTGPGIPAAERERVFERFVQLEAARGHGAGLGLAIVKSVIDAHAGSVHVEENLPSGCCVVMALPCASAPADAPAVISQPGY